MERGRALGALTPVVLDSATGTLEVVAASAGKRIRLWRMIMSLASGTLTIKSASTALSGPLDVTGLVLEEQQSLLPWYETAEGEALNFTTTGQLSGTAWVTVE